MSEEATVPLSEDVREAIAFVGETLGPFYLQDPVKGCLLYTSRCV